MYARVAWCFSISNNTRVFQFQLILTTTGGALGWKTKGSLDPEFERVAYDLAVSSTSKPIVGEAKTSFGYHIILVEGRK